MNKSEMELQAIRKKLESLKAEPPSEEGHSLPWSAPTQASSLSHSNRKSTEKADPQVAQIAATVETLKQRSNPHLQQFPDPTETAAPTPTASLSTEALDRQIELTWQRLGSQAQKINELSQMQETAMLEFKEIVDQLEREMRKRHRLDPSDNYADASTLMVCEYESAVVPDVAQDRQGRLILSHRPIDLYQAEREAALTAQVLRDRHLNRNLAFEGSDRVPDLGFSCLIEEPIGFIQTLWNKGYAQVRQLIAPSPRRTSRRSPGRRPTHRPPAPSFSWLDMMIWFSSATILRLGLNFLLAAYPGLQLLVLVMFLAVAAIALYRIAFTRHADLGLGYRLLSAIAGLLVGGRL